MANFKSIVESRNTRLESKALPGVFILPMIGKKHLEFQKLMLSGPKPLGQDDESVEKAIVDGDVDMAQLAQDNIDHQAKVLLWLFENILVDEAGEQFDDIQSADDVLEACDLKTMSDLIVEVGEAFSPKKREKKGRS